MFFIKKCLTNFKRKSLSKLEVTLMLISNLLKISLVIMLMN
jgi:hypothetical protein